MPEDFDYDAPSPDAPGPEPPRSRLPLIVGLALLVVVVVLGYLYFRSRTAPPPVVEAPAVVPTPTPTPPPTPEPFADVELPPLPESDSVVRDLVSRLTDHPALQRWLGLDQLVRRFTVVVDNVAEGASPRIHLVKLAPKESFTVHEEGGRLLIAEEGYRRYDTAASLFASLDPELTARLYETLKPLIQQAYRDLGYPRADFDATLERAIRRLLETPIVHGDVEVERGVRSYRYVDPRLEELSPAQKQLLRMGPANVRKVQEQLRALATPLGIPATRLAQTPVIQER